MKIKYWLKIYAFNYLNTNNYKYIYDLENLLNYVLRIQVKKIFILENKIINFKKFIILDRLLFLMKKGIPLPYLINSIEFYSIKFKLSKKVFIPRSDTECLIDFVINKLDPNIKYNIIDLGTGIGVIALSLAINLPKSNIIGIDIDNRSIKLAKINSKILNVKNVKFYNISWFNYVCNNKFNLLISNPPYISEKEFNKINKINKIYEPKNSLVSNNNGLYNIYYIINKFSNFIEKNGFMLIEHGSLQSKKIKNMFKYKKFNKIKTFKDLNNNNRFTYAEK